MTSDKPSLEPLLAPRSIALIGASRKTGTYGRALLDMLVGGGFEGQIYPVNPNQARADHPDSTEHNLTFMASLEDLPEAPDHTVLAVGTAHLDAAFEQVIRAGSKAATIFADSKDHDQKARIKAMAREAGIPLIGPNSMGFHNLDHHTRITPFPVPLDLTPGGMAAVVQSGSILGALLNNDRRFRFNTLISTGSEATTTAADYLHWLLGRSTTRVVGMFLESVRDPEGFLHALERAADLDIPVVILKVGRSEASARMAMSHTGALVGNHQVFVAAAESRGAHLVDTVDEMAALLQVFNQGRRATGAGIASIHDSGGERELIADLAEDLKVPFAQLAPATLAKIEDILEPGLDADNPLDAWGTGHGADEIFTRAFLAMLDDDAVAAGLYMLDWRQNYPLHEMHEQVIYKIMAATAKPVFAASNFALTDNREMAARMADKGLPLVEGSREILVAMKHLLQHGKTRQKKIDPAPHPDRSSWLARLAAAPMDEAESMSLLAAYGMATPEYAVAESTDDAVSKALEIGFPVALKTLADGVHHKTDVDGVKINLTSAEAVAAAYQDMASRLSPRVLVAGMVPGGIELALGAVRDRDFGMAVMISAGGTGVELLDDKMILMPPFDADTVLSRLKEMKIHTLMTGYRGKPPLAITAFAQFAAAFSHLVHDLGPGLEEIDLNPVIVHETAAVAVDALFLPRINS